MNANKSCTIFVFFSEIITRTILVCYLINLLAHNHIHINPVEYRIFPSMFTFNFNSLYSFAEKHNIPLSPGWFVFIWIWSQKWCNRIKKWWSAYKRKHRIQILFSIRLLSMQIIYRCVLPSGWNKASFAFDHKRTSLTI